MQLHLFEGDSAFYVYQPKNSWMNHYVLCGGHVNATGDLATI